MPSGNDGYHLFIQVTEQLGENNEILIVNASTIHPNIYHDSTCVLNVGDHPFIIHPSYVRYDKSRIVPIEKIQNGIRTNTLIPREMLSEDVFNRLIQGFHNSPHVAPLILSFLEEDQNSED